jgi:hypothetical protein
MPEYFVPTLFALISVIYLSLYARESLRGRVGSMPARKAWLRVGLIFAVVSLVLFYVQA